MMIEALSQPMKPDDVVHIKIRIRRRWWQFWLPQVREEWNEYVVRSTGNVDAPTIRLTRLDNVTDVR